MRAGLRRTLLTLYALTDGADAYGGPTVTETAIGTAWARVRPLSGTERFGAQQVTAGADIEITMDWLEAQDLTPKHRLGLGDRRFDILAVLNIEERNREARILAHEATI